MDMEAFSKIEGTKKAGGGFPTDPNSLSNRVFRTIPEGEAVALATIVAAVLVYFGTINTIAFNDFGFNWPNSVHMFQAYIGYGYFIESIISKYKLWRR